ncbi:uncharacterized protein B0H64DRAFT_134784 [Chaetomium fimeti]|uniref:Uncharacterized protein n=1 Tax=Chaetomium fimeti TaxID=1854472 RepID=A0AAE0HK28_9PEZI|nr:hypothetical protein B0H64DRAFT_134784 [Chaetomium fimeti]
MRRPQLGTRQTTRMYGSHWLLMLLGARPTLSSLCIPSLWMVPVSQNEFQLRMCPGVGPSVNVKTKPPGPEFSFRNSRPWTQCRPCGGQKFFRSRSARLMKETAGRPGRGTGGKNSPSRKSQTHPRLPAWGPRKEPPCLEGKEGSKHQAPLTKHVEGRQPPKPSKMEAAAGHAR